MDDITQQAPFIFWEGVGYDLFPAEEPVPEEENYSREGWNT